MSESRWLGFLRSAHARTPIPDEVLDTPLTHLILRGGDPEFEWCDNCLTTARIRIPLVWVTPTGVSQVGAFAACRRCEPEKWGDA